MSDPFELSDFLRTRARELRQPAPLVEFFEVELPGGQTPLRYVDFADADARGSLPKKVPFNGVEFDSIPITRGDLQEGEEGSSHRVPVTIADPLHQAAFFLRENQYLDGAHVQWWLAAYDQLASTADALTQTFRVVGARISEAPPNVTLMLGHPNLFEARIPKYYYDRGRCLNAYHDRYTPGGRCTYPSNEFSGQTAQDLTSGATYEEKKRKHGWYTQHASRADTFSAHLYSSGKLVIAATDPSLSWEDDSRYGPYFYRPLSAGDFDVETIVDVTIGDRPGWLAGILVQDETPAAPVLEEGEPDPPTPVSSWLFWGLQNDGAGGAENLRRATSSSVSTDAATVTSDAHLRVIRSGNDFALQSRASTAGTWATRETVTMVLPDMVRVGLVAGTSATPNSGEPLSAAFEYIRFNAGGLPTCSFNFNDADGCQAHDNAIQFNGFAEIPNDRAL